MNKLAPLLMETESNFEAMAGAFSPDDATLDFICMFRAYHDYAAMRFHTTDSYLHGMHSQARYPTDESLAGVAVSFAAEFFGVAADYREKAISQSLTVEYTNGRILYATLGYLGKGHYAEESFSYYTGASITLGHDWLRWFDKTFVVAYSGWIVTGYRDVFDGEGNYLYTEEIRSWVAGEVESPNMDNKAGILHYTPGIPWSTNIVVKYWYTDAGEYHIDFDQLRQGVSFQDPLYAHLPAAGIRRVSFPMVAHFFDPENPVYTGDSQEGRILFTQWEVTGSGRQLGAFPPAVPAHRYRYAEGYDDEYYRNPRRLVQAMYQLGYRECVDFYIGASHFYDKTGKAPGLPSGYTNACLLPEVGCNPVFLRWFTDYVTELAALGYHRFILSVAMENLQMPDSWKQLLADGSTPGQTGWFPPTCFYSPTNPAVRQYIALISRQLMDIIQAAGLQVLLQLGEPWWWWQEFMPGDINTPFPGRPPCFYDAYTQSLYTQETGRTMPRWYTSDIDVGKEENRRALVWLKEKLGEYSEFMASLISGYPGAHYGILFFPPSVIDTRRVPIAMRLANVPWESWAYPKLDYIQIEDYDWIIHDSPFHQEIFDFAYHFFGYQEHLTEYFSGFVLIGEPAAASPLWQRIDRAARQAISRGMETYIWAGTQIRRDDFSPGAEFVYLGKSQKGYPNSQGVLCQPMHFHYAPGGPGVQNILDLNALELTKSAAQKIVAGQFLTLYNHQAGSDLFAHASYPTEAGRRYRLVNDFATQTIYVYLGELYGETLATLYPGSRQVEFLAPGPVRIAFYCMSGTNIAEWSNVLCYGL